MPQLAMHGHAVAASQRYGQLVGLWWEATKMNKYMDLLQAYTQVSEVTEVVGEWKLWIGEQTIKIKISRSENGNYIHVTSHFYHGSKQNAAYISSRNSGGSIEETLHSAMNQLLSFYDPNDADAIWKENDNY
jgi:hypothetical protein